MTYIFLVLDNFHQLLAIKNAFKSSSILNFTYEIENNKTALIPEYITNAQRNQRVYDRLQKAYRYWCLFEL